MHFNFLSYFCLLAAFISLTIDYALCNKDNANFEPNSDDDCNEYAPGNKYLKINRKKRQAVLIGSSCNENIECLTINGGAYCDSTKRCACLMSSINIAGFCWPKINPGQTGCQYNEQCNSVWPGSTCSSSNVCNCPNNQPASRTEDGTVCTSAGACPTNGLYSKLKTQGADGVYTDAPCADPLVPRCGTNDYDCFCTPPNTQPSQTCDGITYCCPSRALACIMPKEEGVSSGGLRQTKYYYNSATNECEILSFNGAGGNANNFDTKPQCESYCKTACTRGRPQYTDPDILSTDLLALRTLITCSATSSTCNTANYACNTASTTSTNQYCCPTPTFICTSTTGGVVTLIPGPPASVVPDSGIAGPNLQPKTRYFYDSSTSTCRTFTYNGQGGNYNNFATAAECQAFCSSSLCGAGDILRDQNQVPVSCSGGASCPSRYTCTNNFCCPSREFVCSLPVASGSCLSFSQKWYFNTATRTCTEFTYNGCQGNFNRFDTFNACQTFCSSAAIEPKCPQGSAAKDGSGNYYVCAGTSSSSLTVCPIGYYCYYDGLRYGCCPTKSQTCETEGTTPNAGFACVTPVSRWYYNATSRRCDQFIYNGCDGNSNNFATQLDCQDYCGVGGCKEAGGPPFVDSSGQNRICTPSGNECPGGYTCSQVVTATSATNFFCCATRDMVCRLPQDQGTTCGTTTLTRYFFNPATRTCESFIYRGCGGNRNNFASTTQCQTYCNSAACAGGQVVLTDSTTTSRLVTCQTTATTSSGCPTGYSCVTSSLLGQNVCCGSNAPPGTCPSGQSAYIDSFSNSPLQCIQNTDGQCPVTPNRYFCQPSFTQGSSFCCASAVIQCARGGSVGLDSFNNPQQCTPNIPQNCPSGFECQATTFLNVNITSATGYCCGTPNPCGQGFSTLFTNNQPVTCEPGSAVNPCTMPSYTCTRTTSGVGYCCAPSVSAVNPCAVSGKTPYYIQNNPTVCISGSGNTGAGCPVGYTCDLYPAFNTFYCCTAGGVTPTPGQSACPSGSSSGVACSTSPSCGAGFVCKPGTGTGACCPSPASACSQPQLVGQTCITANPSQRYSYNPATRSCTPFTYLGCGSNSNNFFSAQACEEFCMPGLCARGRPQYVTGQSVQTCTTAAQCNLGFECVASQFGGAGSICCQSRASVCAQPADSGRLCTGLTVTAMQMWYYNTALGGCQQYSYNGCGGNSNSFETQADCQSFCGGGTIIGTNPCPSGRTAQTNPSTGQPQLCNMGGSGISGCNAGFGCAYSTTAQNYYCCSSGTIIGGGSNGCPSGSPFLYPGTNSPLACSPSNNRCPNGYACLQSTTRAGVFQCCSSSVAAAVPQAQTLPTIRCTGDKYCQDRLKSSKAKCNMSSFACTCDPSEIFSNNSCVRANG